MVINFDAIEQKQNPNFKGGEGLTCIRAFTDGMNKMMQVTLEPGATIGMHTHEGDCEIIYVISGKGTVRYDGGVEVVLPGQAHYCPKGHTHQLMNCEQAGELVVFAVVPVQ